MQDKVTILIPNLNGAEFLEKMLISCLTQTLESEILVIDNGSSDESLKILEKFSRNYPKISYRICSEKGISNALNYGLKLINTEFVCRLDSDDTMMQNRLVEQITYMLKNPKVAVLGSQVNYITASDIHQGVSNYPVGKDLVKAGLTYSNPIAHPSVIFRTSYVKKIGGYNPRMDGAEDFDLWMRLSHTWELDNLAAPLTNYRQHEYQVSKKFNLYRKELRARIQNYSLVLRNSNFNFKGKVIYSLKIVDLILVCAGVKIHRKLAKVIVR